MDINDDGLTSPVANREMGKAHRYGGQTPQQEQQKPKKSKKKNLDSPESKKLFRKLQEWFDQEWQRQAHNRFQMAMDEDYYDSLQWTEDDAAELIARGQAPTVINECKPTIDWMIGTERRTRIDYKVLPRRKEGADDAEVKTKILKYLSDTNKQPYSRSDAFAKACKGGLGWIEIGVRGDDADEPIFYRNQDWRFMLYDSNSVERDLSDARYIFRWKYLDEDIALAYFPDREKVIKQAIIDGSGIGRSEQEDEMWYLGARVTEPGQDYAASSMGKYRPYDGSAFALTKRNRVKFIECWYLMPVSRKKFMGGTFHGQYYDQKNPAHYREAYDGECSLYDKVETEIRCAIFTESGLVWEGKSPYEHGKFPFVPIWAYRRARDNAPYGPIRVMRDPQDGINKRNSKALWILSSNQVIADKNAVDDIEEAREEVARPDGWLEKNPGKEINIRRDTQLAQEHLMLMDRDQRYVRNMGGVTDENLGRQTNANSGKAIIARQEQGGVVTTELFDNLRFAIQTAGEIELSLVEQFYTDEKVVRVTGERGNPQFVDINKRDEATGEILNDITTMHADFIVSEQDYRDSLRIAMFESLFEIVGRLAQMSPDVALRLLDLVVEMADVPNRDELVARIRQINGMRDPESEPTEEELAAEQNQKQIEALTQDIAIKRMTAELQEIAAKGEKLTSDALNSKLDAMTKAFESAGMIIANPGIAPVADDLLESAGFEDSPPDEQNQIPEPVDIFDQSGQQPM